MQSDGLYISVPPDGLVYDVPLEYHDDTVGEFEQFIEILAEQQDCRSAITSRHDLRVDLASGSEVEADARILSDQHTHCA